MRHVTIASIKQNMLSKLSFAHVFVGTYTYISFCVPCHELIFSKLAKLDVRVKVLGLSFRCFSLQSIALRPSDFSFLRIQKHMLL